jgi:hypothetical protein
MQDGTVTTESLHGKMGSVGRTPAGCHSGMGTGVHTLQSCSIYSYSHVPSPVDCWFSCFGISTFPLIGECGEPRLQSVRGERLHLPR